MLLWERASDVVRARIGAQNFTAWIAPLHFGWDDDVVVLEAPDATVRDCVARHFVGIVEEAMADQLGRPCVLSLRLRVERPPLPIYARPPSTDHTFASFVVGESNARAHAAAQAVADRRVHAPLFLYGPAGVGKTHLLHAVFHALDQRDASVVCLPAAELVTMLVEGYRGSAGPELWDTLGPLGALLLDDIHSLAGQEQVQEQLFEGLATWSAGGRLLVLTSDRAPDQIPELAARLESHFAGAVITRIDPPETALRFAIVQYKARALGLALGVGLAARIATQVSGNVRRLEGALTRLLAHARLTGREVDDELAVMALPELRPTAPPPPLTVERIVQETASAFGVSVRGLLGPSRREALVVPRQLAMYLARKLLHRPFAELAPAFARGHTTLLHAWQTMGSLLQSDTRLSTLLESIEARLRQPRAGAAVHQGPEAVPRPKEQVTTPPRAG